MMISGILNYRVYQRLLEVRIRLIYREALSSGYLFGVNLKLIIIFGDRCTASTAHSPFELLIQMHFTMLSRQCASVVTKTLG